MREVTRLNGTLSPPISRRGEGAGGWGGGGRKGVTRHDGITTNLPETEEVKDGEGGRETVTCTRFNDINGSGH